MVSEENFNFLMKYKLLTFVYKKYMRFAIVCLKDELSISLFDWSKDDPKLIHYDIYKISTCDELNNKLNILVKNV